MSKKIKGMSIAVIVFAAICLVLGLLFIYQGIVQQNVLVEALTQEKITMAPFGGEPNDIINSMDKAMKAGDTVREHRHSIAPSYGELLGGEKYNPANPIQLTYAQAMNLENYLYLAVASFGLVQVILAVGGFMILTALALGIIGGSLLITTVK